MKLASISNSHILPTFLNFATPEECDLLDRVAPDVNDMADELGAKRVYVEKPRTTWGGARVVVFRFKGNNGTTLKTKTLGAMLP